MGIKVTGNLARFSWLLVGVWLLASPGHSQSLDRMDFLGSATLPTAMDFDDTRVGGLSGIVYYPSANLYFAISDDRSERAPARFYSLRIGLEDGRLAPGGVSITGVTRLQDEGDRLFRPLTIDAEGIALAPSGSLFISSEGFAREQEPPFVREFSSNGTSLGRLPIPRRFRPTRGENSGIYHNLGFESLALTPDGAFLFTATENGLIQDGPKADLSVASPSRILRFDLARRKLVNEYLYWVEPVNAESVPPGGLQTRGLVELIAISSNRLLALERAYSAGVGHTVALYNVALDDADDISERFQVDPLSIRPVRKELLFDFADLNIPLDNIEGMTFGPDLPDGRKTLLFISDDNFSDEQKNLFLAFAVSSGSTSLPELHGSGHSTAMEDSLLLDIRGIVTAVENREPGGFWIQGPESSNSERSPNGIFVSPQGLEVDLKIGDQVRVGGRIQERGSEGRLSTTILDASRIDTLTRGNVLPPAAVIGVGGRAIPSGIVDDDGMTRYEPQEDPLDFFESLEGMRVEVREAVVVGPTDSYGTFTVVSGAGPGASTRTPRGGLLLEAKDVNPERLMVDSRLLGEAPSLHVGDRFSAPLTGVVSYEYGTYRILPTGPLPPIVRSSPSPDRTTLKADENHLTAATFNVLNLDAQDDASVFEELARTIVEDLASPDLLGLQEIQDDSGPADDGVVTANETLTRLLNAIAAAGGPTYLYRQIDPENGAEGGQPGSNIRVALLFNPARIAFFDRGEATAQDPAEIVVQDGYPQLSLSPGRLAPKAPAFVGDSTLGFAPSRKPLAAELAFQGHRIFVVVAHLKSKGGDDAVFGSRQPPVARTEPQRLQQARLIQSFTDKILAAEPAANVIVLGDMNEHEFRPPLAQLTTVGESQMSLTNLMEWVPITDRYSFNYQGNSQLLDHILISPNLVVNAAPEIDIVHVNADVSASSSSSDHDPVVVRLELPPTN
ncbi:MAG: esterase-like activity of phytase family protein [Deltaproteobacteria bacterium]|nr:esterase-like activity of phytase family protein [Deltaproteobacteria bacterium]